VAVQTVLGFATGDLQVEHSGGKDPEDEQDDQTVDNLEVYMEMQHRDGLVQQRMGLRLHLDTARRMDWGAHAHCVLVAHSWDRARRTDRLSLQLLSWPVELREAVAGTGEAA
jgi:hypothetical protein